MGATPRMLALVLVLTLLAGGPLAPLAGAQQAVNPRGSEAEDEVTPEMRQSYERGAIAADFLYVPGKALVCGTGVAFGVFLMLITFGSAYRSASGAAREGCGGKWTMAPEDLYPRKQVSNAFDWETHRYEWEAK